MTCGQYEKCLKYSAQLKNASFTPEGRFTLLLCEGDAFGGLKQFSKAYDSYAHVLEKGPASLASRALAKAYAVSSEHPLEVRQDAGSVIARAETLSKEKPLLVSEFWTRLAVDSYNAGDYSKSLTYFKNAENGADASLKQLALIYKTEIEFVTSKKPLPQSASDALKAFEKDWSKCGFKAGEGFYEDACAAKARYYGIAENWDETLKTSLPLAQSSLSPKAKKNCRLLGFFILLFNRQIHRGC